MPEKKEEILITGAGGALAAQVISRLKNDYNIVAVDFRKKVNVGKNIVSYKVDFNKRGFEDIFRSHNLTSVIHLGRILETNSSRNNRYNANVLGTQKLYNLCIKYNVHKITMLSTLFVYGANAYNPALLDESAPLMASEISLALVDAVELENLSNIYFWKNPELNITVLRPCRIVGPGMRNSTSLLLSLKVSPVLIGFSPIMQFLHIEDMADAIVLAYEKNVPGVYNVSHADWIPYQEALVQCGCTRFPIPSVPPILPYYISKILKLKAFPSYLLKYFKYPIVIDGSLFEKTFGFKPKKTLRDIFKYYSNNKL